MKILFLSFYYQPDLCAGSFRSTALVEALQKINPDIKIDIYTSMPNRYSSYKVVAPEFEELGNIRIFRKKISNHKSGFVDQARAFTQYFFWVLAKVRKEKYDVVYATSSRLFTAFLGAVTKKIVKPQRLILDIRDIFPDTLDSILKPGLAKKALLWVIAKIEKFTFKQADYVNFVSEGFSDYFVNLVAGKPVSYYCNGIDNCFLAPQKFSAAMKGEPLKILYAGNIGTGQSLASIIPATAKKLGPDFQFKVIGAGGQLAELKAKVAEYGLSNLELVAPMPREQLIAEYAKADVLFLHLGDYRAFERVLPSKIFEYAALQKPMVAGVAGFARKFIQANVEEAYVFDPGDVAAFVEILSSKRDEWQGTVFVREEFIAKFNRSAIMQKFAEDICR